MFKMNGKVALCFFGLTRSLKHTISSIEQNIFQPLRDNDVDFQVYLHTYDLTTLSNPRSGEKDCALDANEWRLLKPDSYEITNQTKFDVTGGWDKVKRFGDVFYDNFCSLQNLGRQLNSLSKVTTLWEESGIDYSAVLFLRPDLQYKDPLDVEMLHKVMNNSLEAILVTPSWQQHLGGLNDRFAIASPLAALAYGKRIERALEFCESLHQPLHSEKLVRFAARQSNLELSFTPMRASRVRADGRLANEQF